MWFMRKDRNLKAAQYFVVIISLTIIAVQIIFSPRVFAQAQIKKVNEGGEVLQQTLLGGLEKKKEPSAHYDSISSGSNWERKDSPESEIIELKIVDYINQHTFDDILSYFGGRAVHEHVLVGNQHVLLPTDLDSVDDYLLDETFNQIKNNPEEYAHNITSVVVGSSKSVSDLNDEVLASFLLINTYIERWYAITSDGVRLSEELLYDDMTFDDWIIAANKIKGTPVYLASQVSDWTYSAIFSEFTGLPTLPEFIESFLSRREGVTDYGQWFESYFKGDIIHGEVQKITLPFETNVWEKLKHLANANASAILPLLSSPNDDIVLIEGPSILAFSSKRNYGQDYHDKLQKTANNFLYYISNLLNTSSSSEKIRLTDVLLNHFTIPVYDLEKTSNGKVDYTNREDQLSQFYNIQKLFNGFDGGSNAFNATNYIQFNAVSLDNNYGGTLAHEFMHSFDEYLSDGGFRPGIDVESITARIDNNWFSNEGVGFNIYNLDVDEQYTDGLYNSSYRFSQPSDLQEYFGGYVGLIYALNQATADMVLGLTPSEQVGFIRQWDQETNTIKTLSEEEIIKMNLDSVDDLVDNNIGIFDKTVKDGILPSNGYASSEYLFNSLYFSYTDDTTVVKPLEWQVQMIDELLSLQNHQGWDAVKLYTGHTYTSDDEAIRAITGDPSITLQGFRKYQLHTYGALMKKGLTDDTYQEVLDQLKTGKDDLRKVKTQLYQKYMKLSDEFRQTVFTQSNPGGPDPSNWINVSLPTQIDFRTSVGDHTKLVSDEYSIQNNGKNKIRVSVSNFNLTGSLLPQIENFSLQSQNEIMLVERGQITNLFGDLMIAECPDVNPDLSKQNFHMNGTIAKYHKAGVLSGNLELKFTIE